MLTWIVENWSWIGPGLVALATLAGWGAHAARLKRVVEELVLHVDWSPEDNQRAIRRAENQVLPRAAKVLRRRLM